MTAEPHRIAIACQGGGSHTSFTAGVLQGILERQTDELQIVALSGASGGAICALLVWDGLLRGQPGLASEKLDRFWNNNSARDYWDAWANYSVQLTLQMRRFVAWPEFSPYVIPPWGQERLRHLLEDLVDFESARELAQDSGAPKLLVGAVDVQSGEFDVFRGPEMCAECLLASAAIPNLFRAVSVKGALFWDGLFSQNPPVRELAEAQPDEIWVIQINPSIRSRVPQTVTDIQDRRNELAGNLSLEQELRFIEKINQLREECTDLAEKYRHIKVRRIVMQRDLDYGSKLNRSVPFIRDMMTYGQLKANSFLDEREQTV